MRLISRAHVTYPQPSLWSLDKLLSQDSKRMQRYSLAITSRRATVILHKRSAHSKSLPRPSQPVIIRKGYLVEHIRGRGSLMRTASRPPTPNDADTRHIDKKPRLEVEVEGANGVPVQLDAPADAMLVEPGETGRAKTGRKAIKRAARKARRKGKPSRPEPYSNEHVLFLDAKGLLGEDAIKAVEEGGEGCTAPFELLTELELTVSAISSIGELTSLRWVGASKPRGPCCMQA